MFPRFSVSAFLRLRLLSVLASSARLLYPLLPVGSRLLRLFKANGLLLTTLVRIPLLRNRRWRPNHSAHHSRNQHASIKCPHCSYLLPGQHVHLACQSRQPLKAKEARNAKMGRHGANGRKTYSVAQRSPLRRVVASPVPWGRWGDGASGRVGEKPTVSRRLFAPSPCHPLARSALASPQAPNPGTRAKNPPCRAAFSPPRRVTPSPAQP
jgi:hypothetical protein